MTREARQFTVHGRVQGVWFRDSTRREAERLGITGHAINLPDGGVEVLACGTLAALAELEDWLRKGPPLASVMRVESAKVEVREMRGFRIG
jgi:acylphosphatase